MKFYTLVPTVVSLCISSVVVVKAQAATDVPHPILFFLPDYALTRLAKYAPDFWAWRRGVFRFINFETVSL